MRRWAAPRAWIGLEVVLAIVALLCVIALGEFERPATLKAAVMGDIDGYPVRTTVTGCASPMVERPGVADFRALLLTQVGGGDDGLAGCKKIANSSGDYSDHADGRAWDWHVRADRPADRALVEQVLNWLLRTDERGHRNAMARRLGITYIIWNHGYYRVGSDQSHWVPYTGTSDPHDTHVHFSFSVAGADQRTSWWTGRAPLVWSLATSGRLTFGEGGLSPLAGDWDGDGRDSIGVYNTADRRFSLRDTVTSGDPTVTTPAVGGFGAIPLAGDWDGNGRDEIGVYEPWAHRFLFYSLAGEQARPPQAFGADGDLPIIGDWNGDGVDDVGTRTSGGQTFSMLLPNGSVRTQVFGRATDTPVVGDWNGDGVDDIGAFRWSTPAFLLAAGFGANGGQIVRSVNHGAPRYLPIVGDWDGTGVDAQGVVTTR